MYLNQIPSKQSVDKMMNERKLIKAKKKNHQSVEEIKSVFIPGSVNNKR